MLPGVLSGRLRRLDRDTAHDGTAALRHAAPATILGAALIAIPAVTKPFVFQMADEAFDSMPYELRASEGIASLGCKVLMFVWLTRGWAFHHTKYFSHKTITLSPHL